MWTSTYKPEDVLFEIADRPGRVGQLIVLSIPPIQHHEILVWDDLPNEVWVPIYKYLNDKTERKRNEALNILVSKGLIPYPVEEFIQQASDN